MLFSIQATVKSLPTENKTDSFSTSVTSNLGDHDHDDLERIEIKLEKTSEEHSSIPSSKSTTNNRHSPQCANSTTTSGFSLKNPVSSFRSWVSDKKTSKEDPTSPDQSTNSTGKKVETTPTPRKSSVDLDTSRRSRTNSATVPNTSSYYQENDTTNNSARIKKKSSFSIRPNNPIALLKRSSEAPTANPNESETMEQSGTSNTTFGYLKNLVRGEKQ